MQEYYLADTSVHLPVDSVQLMWGMDLESEEDVSLVCLARLEDEAGSWPMHGVTRQSDIQPRPALPCASSLLQFS